MMKRVREPAPKSGKSVVPQHSQFASRPFASKAEEHEAPVGEPRVSFSLADIDIFPRETMQPKLRLGPVGDRKEQEVGDRFVDSAAHAPVVQRYVKVGLYEGALGLDHIGVGVNSDKTKGFSPGAGLGSEAEKGSWVEGEVKEDEGLIDSLTIKTNPQQEAKIQAALNRSISSSQKFNLYKHNCAQHGAELLNSGGLKVRSSQMPRAFFEDLKNRFGEEGSTRSKMHLAKVEKKPLQGRFESNAMTANPAQAELRPNRTGMPDRLKAGIESLSGIDMSDVRVHANSDRPGRLNALAYTQGNQIHLGPGQERHLPHEAWHVVQQKQGRVRATGQLKGGVPVNDDKGLEHEADAMMGIKAMQIRGLEKSSFEFSIYSSRVEARVVQRVGGASSSSETEMDVDSVAEAQDSEQQQAELIIELPPLHVDANLMHEAQRQLALQLQGLRTLTARQWLMNLILNRMKTTEQQINQNLGTEEGKKLALKIDDLLQERRDLALLVMDTVLERMQNLYSLVKGNIEAGNFVMKVITAASMAKEQKEVYLAFRYYKGLDNLAVLNEAGLSGGIGRQHGPGDEKSFRKQFGEGIELARQMDPTVAKNACLHNPDQCAGGPLEILWRMGQTENLMQLKSFYNESLVQFLRAKYLLKSYQDKPPRLKDGSPDEQLIEEQSEDYSIKLDQVEEAASRYIHAILDNLGNLDVNSLLGMSWMTGAEGIDQINRVDAILDKVIQMQPEELDRIHLSVKMRVEAESSSTVPMFADRKFPDFTTPDYKHPTASKISKRHRSGGGHDEKICKGIQDILKKRGKQQQTYLDCLYKPEARPLVPEFFLENWEDNKWRQRLPDIIMSKGVVSGQMIIINGKEYVVIEDKTQTVEPTYDNMMGRVMFVYHKLRGG